MGGHGRSGTEVNETTAFVAKNVLLETAKLLIGSRA
jgi:hypothetical protein